MDFLDLIFPKYCINCKKYGDFVCDDCFSKLSFNPEGYLLLGEIKVFIGLESSFLSKKLIRKFRDKPNLHSLSGFISDLFYESLIQQEEFNRILKNEYLLIPFPLPRKIIRSRGYNQNELLAKQLGKRFKFEAKDLIRRDQDKFYLRNGSFKLKDKNILIVLDVIENKSYFNKIYRLLKGSGVKSVYGISFIKE